LTFFAFFSLVHFFSLFKFSGFFLASLLRLLAKHVKTAEMFPRSTIDWMFVVHFTVPWLRGLSTQQLSSQFSEETVILRAVAASITKTYFPTPSLLPNNFNSDSSEFCLRASPSLKRY
jgi:hypothetical protein